jgi:hypothetical protein
MTDVGCLRMVSVHPHACQQGSQGGLGSGWQEALLGGCTGVDAPCP